MNRALKNALKNAFDAPEPRGKEAFLRQVKLPPVSLFSILRRQIAYIRKWVWGMDFILLALSLRTCVYLTENTLWMLSAAAPLLALTVLTENGRSEACGMAELEIASRFSLKTVLYARLGILGALNFFILCLLVPVYSLAGQLSLLRTGLYLTCPYLLTTFLGLFLCRRFPEKESRYFCIGTTLGVSLLFTGSHTAMPMLYKTPSLPLWLSAFVLFGAGALRESFTRIRQTQMR